MKKSIFTILALILLTSCSSAKVEKKTEFGEKELASTSELEFQIKSVRKSYGDEMWLEDNSIYVVVEMSIKNISKEKQSISTFDWKLQNAALTETDVSNIDSTIGGETFSVDVLPGGTVEAIFYFEQPLDNSGLVLAYYSNMFSEEPEIKINLTTDCSDVAVSETPYAIGESVTYRDKIYSIEKVQTSYGKDYTKPSSGNVFLGVTVKIKNNSSVDIAEISSNRWKVYDDKGVSYEYSYFSVWDTESFYDKKLEPGSEYSYIIAFEVPKNGKWRLAYYANMFDEKEKFSIILN